MLATEALDLFTTLGDAGGRAEAFFVLGTVEMYWLATGKRRGSSPTA